MSKSCKNLANQTLFNLHLFDNVRYVFGDGDLGAHRRLAGAATDFPAADDGKPRHVGTELVVAIAQDGDFLVERVNFVVLGHETRGLQEAKSRANSNAWLYLNRLLIVSRHLRVHSPSALCRSHNTTTYF